MALFVTIGYSSWLSFYYDYVKTYSPSDSKSVAYVSGDHYTCYSSIEDAVKIANALDDTNTTLYTITVFPSTNPTIRNNFTINKNITLNIDYEVDGKNGDDAKNNDGISLNVYNNSTYIKNIVTVAPNVTITNNGIINIGGITSGGGGGKSACGATSGYFTKLALDANAKIINNPGATINAYGYLTEVNSNNGSQIIAETGSSIYAPFLVRDFRGGSITSNVYSDIEKKHYSPFNQMEVRNIEPTLIMKYNSYFYGWGSLYAGSQQNITTINLIGNSSDFLFQSTDDNYSYLKAKYNRSTEVLVLNLYGGYINNPLLLTINIFGEMTISTEKAFFPVSFRHHVYLNKAEGQEEAAFDFLHYYKLMPGALFSVGQNVKLNGGYFISYPKTYQDIKVGGTIYPTQSVGGTFIVNGDTNFLGTGGEITTNSEGAKLFSKTSHLTSYELIRNSGGDKYTAVNCDTAGLLKATQSIGIMGLNIAFTTYLVNDVAMWDGISKLSVKYLYTNFIEGKEPEFKIKINSVDVSQSGDYTSDLVENDVIVFYGFKNIYRLTLLVDGTKTTYTENSELIVPKKPTSYEVTIEPYVMVNVTVTKEIDNGATHCDMAIIFDGVTLKHYEKDEYPDHEFIGQAIIGSILTVKVTTPNTETGDWAQMYINETVFKYEDGAGYLVDSGDDLYLRFEEISCVTADSSIQLENGEVKPAGDIKKGDMVKVFNHETGKIESAPILFNDHSESSAKYFDIINLVFSNNTIIKIYDSHCFFDLTLMKYVSLDNTNFRDYFGHLFYGNDSSGESFEVKLDGAFISCEYVKLVSPVSRYHLNYFVNGLLSIPGDIEGFYNIFEYGKDLKYDEEKKRADIEKYGLFTYEDLKDYVSEEEFNNYPAAYLKVSIGKGLLTFNKLQYYIDRYID